MTTKKITTIIFDGDDTLWRTQKIYDTIKMKFKVLIESIGVVSEDLIENLDELDAKRVELLDFSKARFLESILLSYAFICSQNNLNWDIQIEKKIRSYVGMLNNKPQLYGDVMPTLERLKMNYDLILYTSGDIDSQKEKIKSLGSNFNNIFSNIFIKPKKTTEELAKLVEEINKSIDELVTIGNSFRSDILPAINLNIKTILVPRGTWIYDEVDNKNQNYSVALSIKEAADLIINGVI